MPYDAYEVMRRELSGSEKLVWAGMPRQGIRFKPSDRFMIPFSMAWGGFALFWEYTAVTTSGWQDTFDYVFPLFGLPFVLIGLHLMIGRFFFDSRRRGRTFYALTNQRVIIASGQHSKTVKSLDLDSLGQMVYVEQSDGSGSISFGSGVIEPLYYVNESSNTMRSRRPSVRPTQFELIEDVKQVYNKIKHQQKMNQRISAGFTRERGHKSA